MQPELTAISLFSGCGGMDLGIAASGFRVAAATDVWNLACSSHRNNRLSDVTIEANIAEISSKELLASAGLSRGDVDLLFGGPPCPPYSKSRFYRKEKPRALADPTSHTLENYIRLLGEIRPRTFLLENVPGIAFKAHHEALALIINSAQRLGYNVSHAILNAADYGVPQIRQRFFLVGWLDPSKSFRFPAPTHSEGESANSLFNLPHWKTAGEALSGLKEPIELGRYRAGGRHADLLREVPPGDNYLFFTAERGYPNPPFKWRSRYWSFLLKLSPDRPSWTIQARRSNNMGPFHWQSRILTIDEIKRIQSFPDRFALQGSIDEQWRQIGNAVPPALAQAVGTAIHDQLLSARSSRIA